MAKLTAKDIILNLGRKLEKLGLKALEISNNYSNPSFFRSHGIQIIPGEADEIDTNGSCTLIITPHAGAISGLIIQVLKILDSIDNNKLRQGAAIQAFKEILVQYYKEPIGSWEVNAVKKMITASLEIVDKTYPPETKTNHCNSHLFDPFADESEDEIKFFRRRTHFIAHSLNENIEQELVANKNFLKSRQLNNDPLVWLKITGINGMVISQHWIPLFFDSIQINDLVLNKVLKSLKRKKLNPEIALIALMNHKKQQKHCKNEKKQSTD
jgi:hypothetical protein